MTPVTDWTNVLILVLILIGPFLFWSLVLILGGYALNTVSEMWLQQEQLRLNGMTKPTQLMFFVHLAEPFANGGIVGVSLVFQYMNMHLHNWQDRLVWSASVWILLVPIIGVLSQRGKNRMLCLGLTWRGVVRIAFVVSMFLLADFARLSYLFLLFVAGCLFLLENINWCKKNIQTLMRST